MLQLILYSLLASVLSLAGGFLVLWRSESAKKIMTPLLAFSAGAFLGVSFLDLLPEAVEAVTEPDFVFVAFLIGVFVFFAFERFLMRYFRGHQETQAGASHADHTESLPYLAILGDSLHNFLDGVVIAVAFVANPALGLSTALAVAAHEIPQEIGDFVILLDQGWSKTKIAMVNILSAGIALFGVFVGYYGARLFEGWLPYLLAGVAGIFAYIALSDLVPEIHHRARHKHVYRVLLPFMVGLILIGYLTSLANH